MGLEKSNWIAGIISAILAFVGLSYTLYYAKNHPDQPIIAQTSGQASTQIGTIGGNLTIVNPTPHIPIVTKKLPHVFKQDTIGSTVKYIENIIGPAKSISKWDDYTIYNYYIVDDCIFTLITDKNDTISGIKLDITDTCTFEWKDVMHNYENLPPPHKLKFGDVMQNHFYTFLPGCLSGCGNAADPESELRFGSSRADGWLMAILTAVHASEENLNASSNLADKLERLKGEDFVSSGKYSCNFDINSVAEGVIEGMRVDSVTIRPIEVGVHSWVGDPHIGDNARCKPI